MTAFVEAADCSCGHCLRLRAAALGLGPPPWDHRVWVQIAPVQDPGHDDPIRNHPDVILAVKEQASARENFDALNDLWLQAVEQHSRATLGQREDGKGGRLVADNGRWRAWTGRDRVRVQRLADAVEEADRRRLVAWERVVAANTGVRQAQEQAQLEQLQPKGQ